jgi:hypothetical protein
MLALLAGWRSQSKQALAGETSTNVADLPQTGQTVDPMVTGDQALADTSAMQLSAPVSLAAAAVADTTPPTVSLTAPAAGTVSGTVTMSANAADNVGVSGVQFLVNGGTFAPRTPARPSLSVNTTTAPTAPTRWPHEPAPPAT